MLRLELVAELVLAVLVGTGADDEDVETALELDVVCVALAETVGTLVDSVREALVCGRSSPQSQGSVP